MTPRVRIAITLYESPCHVRMDRVKADNPLEQDRGSPWPHRARNWLGGIAIGIFAIGCAGPHGVASSEARAALAPTGKLRVAFSLATSYTSKDPVTGELKGVGVDLGRDLARRLGVPLDPIGYPNASALVSGAKTGEWDVALMGISAERAAIMDFSAPVIEVEQGYLVRPAVPIATAADVDATGVRIAVLEKLAGDVHLSRTLKNAVLVRAKTAAETYALLDAGKAEVVAATKAALFEAAATRPGSRILDGRFLGEPIGMGVPKGRDAAAALYVDKFVEEAKVEGLVRSGIDRAGSRGIVVAPLK
jgi:polar amino acid transport system substrate-binding protein